MLIESLKLPHFTFLIPQGLQIAGSRRLQMTRLVATIQVAMTIVAAVAQDRRLVFQVGSELVVMDLIATDESGREVSD